MPKQTYWALLGEDGRLFSYDYWLSDHPPIYYKESDARNKQEDGERLARVCVEVVDD